MLLFFLITVSLLQFILTNAQGLVEIQTTEGKVMGLSTEGFTYFKSVPYADPPVGTLRFQPPRKAKPYQDGVYDATAWKQVECVQPGSSSASEDCLYLDVIIPSKPPSKKSKGYPVHVWIHGGAFIVGSKERDSNYKFAEQDVIAVSINYRLNMFAYLKTSETTPAQNGFLDQQLALRWIQQNIAAFGGNKDLITIHGQSAGANSVELHVTSPTSSGLFHRAIMQSPMAQSYYPTSQDAIATSKALYELLGCGYFDVECAQAASVEKIMEATSTYIELCHTNHWPQYAYDVDKGYWFCGLAPEIGNSILPSQPLDLFTIGMINRVPMIIGTVWNEGLRDSDATYNILRKNGTELYKKNKLEDSEGLYKLFLNQIVDRRSYAGEEKVASMQLNSKRTKAIYQFYPSRANEGFTDMYYDGYNGYKANKPEKFDANYAYNALYYDKWYFCAARNVVRTLQKKLRKNTPDIFVYRFNQVPSSSEKFYNNELQKNPVVAVNNNFWSYNLYPSHGDDTNFFFGVDQGSVDDSRLKDRMFAALVNFIHTGNPNNGPQSGTVGRKWKPYDLNQDNLIVLAEPDSNSNSAMGMRDKQCSFWDRTGYTF